MTDILITLNPELITAPQQERLRELSGGARLIITGKADEIEAALGEAEIVAGHLSPEQLARAGKLRWLQQWGAGTDWLMRHPELAQRDFILTNASGVHAIPISEHILAFLLAFTRRLPEAFRLQQRREWDGDMEALELAGKTMLLAGVGAIGRRTAQIAQALGMRVLGIRSDPEKRAPGIERMYGPKDLLDVLPQADFLVLTLPLTEQTRCIINAEALARMKPEAYLINIGRGGTVDEAALIDALREGRLAGAGLDVFAVEPLPPDSPLWTLPNVIITSHYSGSTRHYNERAMGIFLENLEKFQAGKEMKNVVDKQAGY